jgi:DNA polymerase elongation subunit (family B)
LEEELNRKIGRCIGSSGLESEHPFLSDELHGTEEHCLVWEFEKLYRRFFQAGTKKRYAGHIVWKEGNDVDRIDITGFESNRSDIPVITSEVQPEVIKRILKGDGFGEIAEYVREKIEAIKRNELPLYQYALPGAINKPLEEYGNLQTIRACRYSNDHLGYDWSSGDDPWVVPVSSTPAMAAETDVLAVQWGDELPEGYSPDIDKIVERAFEGPLSPIVNEMGWTFREVRQGKQTGSAGDW